MRATSPTRAGTSSQCRAKCHKTAFYKNKHYSKKSVLDIKIKHGKETE